MVNGSLALKNRSDIQELSDIEWSFDQYAAIVCALTNHECQYLKGREEYTLFKEVVSPDVTQVLNLGKTEVCKNPVIIRENSSGVISPLCPAIWGNDTDTSSCRKPFLAPLDIQKTDTIADVIPSFKVIQSDSMSLNIGFDTEFQDHRDRSGGNRRVLSLQMSIAVGEILIRYFFLVDPRYQEVTADGGQIPLKHCLADVLADLKTCYFRDFPLVLKQNLKYKQKQWTDHDPYKVVDYAAMSDSVIPVTIICHTGKADISIFRRSKYDIDILRRLGEIQGGWMTTEYVHFTAANDQHRNYYWLVSLSVRDTLGLTPADNKSLKALGDVIGKPKIELPRTAIEHMSDFAVRRPVEYYRYAMNDADIVVTFCSELFRCNHALPMTLSSAAASSICASIKEYFGITRKADYDRIYRGLEMLDEGIIPSKDECMKLLKATRYVPIRDNPDAKLVSEYFEEAYTGGFNASFFIGWITDRTTDFDLQNAYPTAMATIIDIDWSKNVRDFPRNYELTWQDLMSPLIPAVAVGDFDFPDDCYCPNIPVPVKGGMKIYPRHGRHVYMTGPDMYLALKLGARIKVFRGFTCQMLEKDGKPSQCLAYAVTNLVQDRRRAKLLYKDTPLI